MMCGLLCSFATYVYRVRWCLAHFRLYCSQSCSHDSRALPRTPCRDNFRVADDSPGMYPAHDWPLARGLYVNLARHRRPCRSRCFANGPTEEYAIAFLAAKRSHENHGQKTGFKDAFGLRSMDSLTPTVWAIDRHDDSPNPATCTKSIREFLERNVPAAEPDDHLRSRRS